MRKNSKSQTNHMKNSNHRVRFYLPGNHPNHPPKTRSPTLSIHYIQVGMLLTLRWASAANPDLVALLHAIFSVFLLSNYNELPHRKYTCELIRSLNVTRTVVVCTNNMYVCSRLDARFSTDSARARPPASCYYFSSPSLYLQRLPPETRARVCVCVYGEMYKWVSASSSLSLREKGERDGWKRRLLLWVRKFSGPGRWRRSAVCAERKKAGCCCCGFLDCQSFNWALLLNCNNNSKKSWLTSRRECNYF